VRQRDCQTARAWSGDLCVGQPLQRLLAPTTHHRTTVPPPNTTPTFLASSSHHVPQDQHLPQLLVTPPVHLISPSTPLLYTPRLASPRHATPRHMTRGSDDWRGGGLMFAPSVSAPVAAMRHQHMFESTSAGASDRRNAGPGGAGEFEVCPRVSSASLESLVGWACWAAGPHGLAKHGRARQSKAPQVGGLRVMSVSMTKGSRSRSRLLSCCSLSARPPGLSPPRNPWVSTFRQPGQPISPSSGHLRGLRTLDAFCLHPASSTGACIKCQVTDCIADSTSCFVVVTLAALVVGRLSLYITEFI
jgi:hypothetical protein